MNLEIYVGNYPARFTNEDIEDLFKDFKGMKLLRNRKDHMKCFAFFLCVDENQVIDVVVTLNGIDVSGRKLVVRAADKELQQLIVESLRENNSLDKHPANQKHCVNYSSTHFQSRNPLLDSPDFGMERGSFDQQQYDSQSHYHFPITQPECEKESISSLQNLSIHDTELSDWNGSAQNLRKSSPKHAWKITKNRYSKENFHMNEKFEDRKSGIPNVVNRPPERIDSYKLNSSIGVPLGISPQNSAQACSSSNVLSFDEHFRHRYKVLTYLNDKENNVAAQSESSDEPKCKSDFYCVSVANFPYQTTITDLYELFEDIDPYNIVMTCNTPNKENRPTEAMLWFKSEDQVTDAIINFDNTLYYGRYLVVSDARDPSMLLSLLNLNAKNT